MRWLFCDPENPRECARRQQVLRRVDDWWREFSAEQETIRDSFGQRSSSFRLPEWMQEHLQAIDERLCWEFGPALEPDRHSLVRTPHSEPWLGPLVRTILGRAPQVPRREFLSFRVAAEAELARAPVEGRFCLDISRGLVGARIGECRKIDLCFHF